MSIQKIRQESLDFGLTGAIAFFGLNTAPAGWLKANGALVSRTTYASLFAVIGTTYGEGDGSTTFALPDMRGEFPRGWDDGRGVDSGRSFGTAQLDQMQRITGAAQSDRLGTQDNTLSAGAVSLNFYTDGSARGAALDAAKNARQIQFDSANSPDARVSSTTDGETRSRNVALLACIKF